jgi:Carboxypeptidase regulatory-like domain
MCSTWEDHVRRLHHHPAVPAALIAIVVQACLARGPVLDTGSKPENVGGTIAGIVREQGSGQPLSGRKVTATQVESGARYEASTASNGGYTIKVPKGKYRLEVELRPGEALSEHPADTEINTSDLDPDRNFVVTVKPPAAQR